MKLGLGTVQFGLSYGVSNAVGKTSRDMVKDILTLAVRRGIRVLDTAAGYGDSEEVLGNFIAADAPFRIVTKTAGNAAPSDRRSAWESGFAASLKKLGRGQIYGLLAHHADDLTGADAGMMLDWLNTLKAEGLVQKIGASVYTAAQIDALLEHCSVDLIQLPLSLLDQRLIRSGHLDKLKRRGVEIHARSIFLQGLFLMAPDRLPPFFAPIQEHLAVCRASLGDMGVTPLEAALGFMKDIAQVDVALCGVNNITQLDAICSAYEQNRHIVEPERFALWDDTFLNPANWPRTH
ncbi:aryl-alcohol dehydrogenase [Oxalobacteraceae bacterium OM1]|nr:aryl-alcohol dehydrogenase [Oxalobacteraceae bacterium OM1]